MRGLVPGQSSVIGVKSGPRMVLMVRSGSRAMVRITSTAVLGPWFVTVIE